MKHKTIRVNHVKRNNIKCVQLILCLKLLFSMVSDSNFIRDLLWLDGTFLRQQHTLYGITIAKWRLAVG